MLIEFQSDVKKSIHLIGNSNKNFENDELVNFLTQNGIVKKNAIEITIFLPIAFVRKMLPTVNWRKNYVEHISDKKKITKSYAENELYKIIKIETENYYAENPESDIIIKIAGRSAEFKVINDFLLENDKADITEIKFTKSIIFKN